MLLLDSRRELVGISADALGEIGGELGIFGGITGMSGSGVEGAIPGGGGM